MFYYQTTYYDSYLDCRWGTQKSRRDWKTRKRAEKRLEKLAQGARRNGKKSLCRDLVHQMLLASDEEQLDILEAKLVSCESYKHCVGYLD